MSHTILLIQRTQSENSRLYKEYTSAPLAMEGIVELYVEKLKRGSKATSFNVKLADVEAFVDECKDFGALIFVSKEGMYAPKGKDWVKKGLEKHFLKQAAAASK